MINNLQRYDGEIINYGRLNESRHGKFEVRVVQTPRGEEIHTVLEA